MPFGCTEPNPFELGRPVSRTSISSFGTGTWDPLLSLAAGRDVGGGALSMTGLAHLVFYENSHGYQAGNRYNVNVTGSRPLFKALEVMAAFDVTRDEAERWDGRLEEEGNLGRTDVLLSFGASSPIGRIGTLSATVGLPAYSRVQGEQGEQPPVFTLSWSPPPRRKPAVEANP